MFTICYPHIGAQKIRCGRKRTK